MKEIGRKITQNLSVGSKHEYNCTKCNNNITNHSILASIDEEGMDYLEKESYYKELEYKWHDTYQIIQCDGCRKISFRLHESNTEDYQEGIEKFFPESKIETHKIKFFNRIPSKLNKLYIETVTSLNSNNLILCAAGIRGMVECLCLVNGIKYGEIQVIDKDSKPKFNPDGTIKMRISKKLDGLIEGLHQKEILSKKQTEILHELRFLGNSAVHEFEFDNEENLVLAIEIMEKTFMNIYDVSEMGETLKFTRLKKEADNKK